MASQLLGPASEVHGCIKSQGCSREGGRPRADDGADCTAKAAAAGDASVANMSADDPGQHTIHSFFYSTATHELDANLLRSVLGTLVSLDGRSAGPVQEAYAILLMSLADNGEK